MIGTIDSQYDVELYFESEEIEKIKTGTIEGVLVKINRPKRQGTVRISLSEEKKTLNGFGIGIGDEMFWGVVDNFHLDVYVGNESYQRLVESGRTGTRQRMQDGSKISLYDLSRMDSMLGLDELRWYIANKDRLPDNFG